MSIAVEKEHCIDTEFIFQINMHIIGKFTYNENRINYDSCFID